MDRVNKNGINEINVCVSNDYTIMFKADKLITSTDQIIQRKIQNT